MVTTYLLFIVAYLLGSIPFALVVGKIGYGIDIREHGSGSFTVTIADILKGTLATSLPMVFGLDIHPLWFGLAAVLGHVYPIFAKFRGGKAVATSAGVLLCYSPVVFAILAVVFFTLLFTTRYVSLSSMVTAVVAVIASIVSGDKIFIIAMCLL